MNGLMKGSGIVKFTGFFVDGGALLLLFDGGFHPEHSVGSAVIRWVRHGVHASRFFFS